MQTDPSRAAVPSVAAYVLLLLSVAGPSRAWATLPLEAESARIMNAGKVKIETAVEIQVSAEGEEIATPLAIEYALTSDLEVQIEPVFYTSIVPKMGANTTGLGDLEGTVTYRIIREGAWLPNIALAAEVKVPTARKMQIGSGEFDYTGYVVVSRRFGPQAGPKSFDLHLNFGYSLVGSPPGVPLDNTFVGAIAGEYHATDRVDVLGEVLGSTSSLPEGGSEGNPNVSPEAAGGELVGLVGARYRLVKELFLSLGVTYDNNNAVVFRQGLTWKFDTR